MSPETTYYIAYSGEACGPYGDVEEFTLRAPTAEKLQKELEEIVVMVDANHAAAGLPITILYSGPDQEKAKAAIGNLKPFVDWDAIPADIKDIFSHP